MPAWGGGGGGGPCLEKCSQRCKNIKVSIISTYNCLFVSHDAAMSVSNAIRLKHMQHYMTRGNTFMNIEFSLRSIL